MSDIQKRKESHIKLAKDPSSQMDIGNKLSSNLHYKALPGISLKDVYTTTSLFDSTLSQPLIIASMTGGSDHSETINRNIAIAADDQNIAFGVGSQRIILEVEEARRSFKIIREHAPNAFVFANLGAVQLNYGVGIEEVQRIIDLIKANAIYLHLNPLQEALQPEGDTDFGGLLDKIESLVKSIDVPVFIKEVGHGISPDIAQQLFSVGIQHMDVAGVGGTSWSWIEAMRSGNTDFQKWFKDFGISTAESIEGISKIKPKDSILVASGGIRSPIEGLDMILSGANFYSAAYPFLESAMDKEPDRLINQLKNWQKGLKIAMFVCGIQKFEQPSIL